MYDTLIVILAVIFVLGVAINIHEFGHFIVAKLFGMRVEAYSFFGLGPRIWGFKVGDTDYRISAIPLGAYVKLYGDEATSSLEGGSSDGETVPESELYELRPKWQKFLVMIGGPFMNLLLAFAIPFIGAIAMGIPAMPEPIVGLVNSGGAAQEAQIQVGDRVVEFDGIKNPTWQVIKNNSLIAPEKEIPIVVEREGKRVPLTIKPKKEVQDGNSIGIIGFEPEMGVEPVVAGSLVEGEPAAKAGLQIGDRVVSFNDKPVKNSQTLTNDIRENKGEPMKLTVQRNGERVDLTMQARQNDDGNFRIGVGFSAGEITNREPAGIGQATAFAWNANAEIIRLTGKVFGQMFSGERSVKDAGVAGPIGIVDIIAKMVRAGGFLGLFPILMVISLNLGIFNLLPIPMLDGGQIAFLGIEGLLGLFGMTLAASIKEKIQLAGLAIILLLMVAVIYLDVARLIG
jgi:regulator of sigma E protease